MKTPERELQRSKDYRKAHPDKCRDLTRTWRDRHPELLKKYQRKHYIKYNDRYCANAREKYRKNKAANADAAALLRARRTALGISQYEAADRLGVPRSTFGHWELGALAYDPRRLDPLLGAGWEKESSR